MMEMDRQRGKNQIVNAGDQEAFKACVEFQLVFRGLMFQ